MLKARIQTKGIARVAQLKKVESFPLWSSSNCKASQLSLASSRTREEEFQKLKNSWKLQSEIGVLFRKPANKRIK